MEPLLDADYTDDLFWSQSNPGLQSGTTADSPPLLPEIGSRVVVGVQRSDLVGTVHFVGPTLFAEGDWIGIELETPSGKNDGSVGSTRYFQCRPLHGIFARPRRVRQWQAADTGSIPKPLSQQTASGKLKSGRSRGANSGSGDQSANLAAAADVQADAAPPAANSATVLTPKAPQKQMRGEGQRASSERIRPPSRTERQGDTSDPYAEEIAEALSLAVAYRKENEKLRPMELELTKARETIETLQQEKANCLEQISKMVAESEECKRLRAAFSEQELELKAFRAAAVSLQSEMEVYKRQLAESKTSFQERSEQRPGSDDAEQRELSILREGFLSLRDLAQKPRPATTSRSEEAADSPTKLKGAQPMEVDAEGIKGIVSYLDEQLTCQEQEIIELRRAVESLSTAVVGTFGNSDQANSTINSLRLQMEVLQKRLADSEEDATLEDNKSRTSTRGSTRVRFGSTDGKDDDLGSPRPPPKMKDLRKSFHQLKMDLPGCRCGKPDGICTCQRDSSASFETDWEREERLRELEESLAMMEDAMERMCNKEMEAVVACDQILESEDLDDAAQDWLIGTFRDESETKTIKTPRKTVHLGVGVHMHFNDDDEDNDCLRLKKRCLKEAERVALSVLADAGADWQEDINLIDSWSDFDLFRFASRAKQYYVAIIGHALFAKHDLVDCLNLSMGKLEKFLVAIDDKYVDNPYHNSLHAADVAQTVHMFMTNLSLGDLEVCTNLMAAACHDVGHPGVTNDFRVKQADEDAITFSDKSVNENMHCALAFRTLQNEDHNFLDCLPADQYALLRRWVINVILGTDMIRHFSQVQNFLDQIGQEGDDVSDWEDRQLLLDILVHSADLSNVTKPRPVALKWTERVLQEFFAQGDREREMNQVISPLCDRETVSRPSSQIGFIQFIVRPIFEGLSKVQDLPDAQRALDNCNDIHEYWKGIKEKEEKEQLEKEQEDSKPHRMGRQNTPKAKPKSRRSSH